MSSPGGLVVSRACEDMAENQWLSLEPIGPSLVADTISVCVGRSSFPGLLAWLRVSQKVLRYLEGGGPGGVACSIYGGLALGDGPEPENTNLLLFSYSLIVLQAYDSFLNSSPIVSPHPSQLVAGLQEIVLI